MSTFNGLIEEIPGISVDRFDGENQHSAAFFLSHCHKDHMEGLSYNFFQQLNDTNRKLYCSHISKMILNGIYQLEESQTSNIIEVPLNESILYDYEHKEEKLTLNVSCISAGHCPGSIMFLFRANGKTVLYTGDFRINMKDYSKLKPLHSSKMCPERFDKIYLDTTFLSTDFMSLPTRKQSSEKICKLAKQWIDKNPANIVILEISANYGSEYLYIELSTFLRTKVHVKPHVYNTYSRIEILRNHITNDPNSTRVHACVSKLKMNRNRFTLPCRKDVGKKQILTIIPSVQKWKGKKIEKIYENDILREQTINVCYSTHASYEELRAFICYFCPKEIFASVCPENEEKEIYSHLINIQKSRDVNVEKKSNDAYIINLPQFTNSILCNDIKSQVVSDEDDV